LKFARKHSDVKNATYYLLKLNSRLKTEVESSIDDITVSLKEKTQRKFTSIAEYFECAANEIYLIKDLVFRASVIDTAADNIRRFETKAMKKELESLRFQYNYMMYLISTGAMEISRWIHSSGINTSNKKTGEHSYVQDILWMHIDERSPEQHDFWVQVYRKIENFREN
jgi:hypothetical protein